MTKLEAYKLELQSMERHRIISITLPICIGEYLNGKLPFFGKYHYGTDYYPKTKKFMIYV
jgi:hypothetical protein